MAKQIIYGEEARKAIERGVNQPLRDRFVGVGCRLLDQAPLPARQSDVYHIQARLPFALALLPAAGFRVARLALPVVTRRHTPLTSGD